MAWYIAKSLEVLRAQLNTLAPRRSTASDGGIGDASHSARLSDHNPTASGQVCARDFTHDPAGGLDGNWLAATLAAHRDPRIKYVIWNRRIIDSRAGMHPWQWMPYTGTNPHDHHVHVSVFAGAVGDDTRAWNLGGSQTDGIDMTPKELQAAVEAGVMAALSRFVASNEVRWDGSNWADCVLQTRNSVVGLQGELEETNNKLDALVAAAQANAPADGTP